MFYIAVSIVAVLHRNIWDAFDLQNHLKEDIQAWSTFHPLLQKRPATFYWPQMIISLGGNNFCWACNFKVIDDKR